MDDLSRDTLRGVGSFDLERKRRFIRGEIAADLEERVDLRDRLGVVTSSWVMVSDQSGRSSGVKGTKRSALRTCERGGTMSLYSRV